MQVHRFGEFVAAHLNPKGETAYLSPKDARAFARALNAVAREIDRQPDFSKSTVGTFERAAPADSDARYKIVRYYYRGSRRRTIERGLTLEQAQAHCANPETSSKTCTSSPARAITRRNGPWFDGYDTD